MGPVAARVYQTVNLVLTCLCLLLYIIAFASAGWLEDTFHDYGLWRTCDQNVTAVKAQCAFIGMSNMPGYFEASRALAVIALLLSIACVITVFLDENEGDKGCTRHCFRFVHCVCIVITETVLVLTLAIFGEGKDHDDTRGEKANIHFGRLRLGWCFALTVVVVVLQALGLFFRFLFISKRSKGLDSAGPFSCCKDAGRSEGGTTKGVRRGSFLKGTINRTQPLDTIPPSPNTTINSEEEILASGPDRFHHGRPPGRRTLPPLRGGGRTRALEVGGEEGGGPVTQRGAGKKGEEGTDLEEERNAKLPPLPSKAAGHRSSSRSSDSGMDSSHVSRDSAPDEHLGPMPLSVDMLRRHDRRTGTLATLQGRGSKLRQSTFSSTTSLTSSDSQSSAELAPRVHTPTNFKRVHYKMPGQEGEGEPEGEGGSRAKDEKASTNPQRQDGGLPDSSIPPPEPAVYHGRPAPPEYADAVGIYQPTNKRKESVGEVVPAPIISFPTKVSGVELSRALHNSPTTATIDSVKTMKAMKKWRRDARRMSREGVLGPDGGAIAAALGVIQEREESKSRRGKRKSDAAGPTDKDKKQSTKEDRQTKHKDHKKKTKKTREGSKDRK